MGKGFLMGAGGGGNDSDDVTATRDYLVEGYTAILSDSDDEPAEGTLPNNGGVQMAESLETDGANTELRARVPYGAYYKENYQGRMLSPYIRMAFDKVRAAIGYTNAAKVLNDTTIAGLKGTMVKRGSYNVGDVANDSGNNRINIYIDQGGYVTGNSSHSNRHGLYILYSTLRNVLGIAAEKLWPGNTIAGVTSNKQTMAGQTITPRSTSQTISCNGKAMTGNIIVSGDSDLVAKNIRSGANIFNVSGEADGWFDSVTDILRDGVFGGWGFEVIEGSMYQNGLRITDNKPKVQTSRQIDFSYFRTVNIHTTNYSGTDGWSYRAKVTLLDTGQSYTSEYQKPMAGATASFSISIPVTVKSRISVEIEHSHTGKRVAITTIWLTKR